MHVQAAGLPQAVLCVQAEGGSSHQPAADRQGRSRALLCCRLHGRNYGAAGPLPAAAGLRMRFPAPIDLDPRARVVRRADRCVQHPPRRFARAAALRLISNDHAFSRSIEYRTAIMKSLSLRRACRDRIFRPFRASDGPCVVRDASGDPEQHLQGRPSHPPWLRRRADPQGQRAHPRRRGRGQADAQGRVDSRHRRRPTRNPS